MEENWKPVVGYEGRYDVSNLGRVRSLPKYHYKSAFIITPKIKPGGYLGVAIYPTKGSRLVNELIHRLVLLAFIGPPPTPQHECRHLDGSRDNCRLSNLAWGTIAENAKDRESHQTQPKREQLESHKLSSSQVLHILWLYHMKWSQRKLHRKFRVSRPAIRYIIKNIWWKSVPRLSPSEMDLLNPGDDPEVFFKSMAEKIIPILPAKVSCYLTKESSSFAQADG